MMWELQAKAGASTKALLEWLVWVAVVAVALLQTGEFDREVAGYAFGATGWPRAVCAAIFIGATGQLVLRLLETGREAASPATAAGAEGADDPPRSLHRSAQRFAIFALPFAYLFLTARFGFYVMTPVFILALMLLLEVRSWVALLAVTATVYGIVLLIFTRFFYVALPVGHVQPFYDINTMIIVLARTGI